MDNRLLLVDKSKDNDEYETEIKNYLSCKNAIIATITSNNVEAIIDNIVLHLTPKINVFHRGRIEYVKQRINNSDLPLGEILDLVHYLTDGYENIKEIKNLIHGTYIWYIKDLEQYAYKINEKDRERTFKKLSAVTPSSAENLSETESENAYKEKEVSVSGGKRLSSRRGRRGARRHTNKRKQKKTKRYRNR